MTARRRSLRNHWPLTLLTALLLIVSLALPRTQARATGLHTLDSSASADVALSQVASPSGGSGDKLYAGNTVSYTITVDNAGPSDAQSVDLQDTLDSAIVASSVKACVGPGCTPLSVTPSGGAIDVAVGPVGAGSTVPVTVTGTVNPSFLHDGGQITNTVSSNTVTADPNPDNNTNQLLATTVNTLADVSTTQVAKNPAGNTIDGSDAAHKIYAGQVITYVATIHNDGPSDSQNVQVMDTFDPQLTNLKSCIVIGTVTCLNSNDFSSYTNSNLLSLGTMPPGTGGDQTVYFQANVPSNVADNTTISNVVNAKSYATGSVPETADPNPDNNTSTVSPTVNTLADVGVTLATQVNPAPAPAQGTPPEGNRNTVTLTITLTNIGPSDAQSVVATDTPPASVDVTSVSSTVGTCSLAPVSCQLGTVAPGSTVTMIVVGAVKNTLRGGPLSDFSQATVSTTTNDPNPTNNQASQTLLIPTVADAPTLTVLNPGNGKLGVQWRPGTNNGCGSVLGCSISFWDIVATPTSGPPVVFNVPAGQVATVANSGNPSQLSFVVPGSLAGTLTNGTAYSVTVQARNNAGDSTKSSPLSETPCSTCAVTTLPATGSVILHTTSGGTASAATARISMAATTSSCPQTGTDGATASFPVESCISLNASQLAKQNAIVALAVQPGGSSDCGGTCLGNQLVFSNPAGESGTGPQVTNYLFLDRTITTDKFGSPCTKRPCSGSTYAYEIWFVPNPHSSDPFLNKAYLIGTSVTSTQCKLQNGVYVNPNTFPSSAPALLHFACVKSLTELNKFTAPNGVNGIDDLQAVVVYKGDPKVGGSG